MPARKGPTVPEMRPRGLGWEKEGIMEMDSSPARKEEVEMDWVGVRGVWPKKETVGVDEAMLLRLSNFWLQAKVDVKSFNLPVGS